jgi:hypothetical protein
MAAGRLPKSYDRENLLLHLEHKNIMMVVCIELGHKTKDIKTAWILYKREVVQIYTINCIAKAFHMFPTEGSKTYIVNAILFTRGNVIPILTLVQKGVAGFDTAMCIYFDRCFIIYSTGAEEIVIMVCQRSLKIL